MINTVNMKDILYIGIELDKESSDRLRTLGLGYIFTNTRNFDPKYYCHHMTVAFKTDIDDEVIRYYNECEGKIFTLTPIAIGHTDKACAVLVETDAPTKSKFKHITIATNIITNGKPVDSNEITNFEKINGDAMALTGILKAFYRK